MEPIGRKSGRVRTDGPGEIIASDPTTLPLTNDLFVADVKRSCSTIELKMPKICLTCLETGTSVFTA